MTDGPRRLEGRAILVTGASGSIGAAIVESLVRDGARAVIHYGRDRGRALALLDRVGGAGVLLQADLADPAGATRLWEEAVAAMGRIDGLVNNAGIRTTIAIEANLDAWQAAWRLEFQVNVQAAVDLCRSAVLHFRRYGGGRIVSMASRAGQRGYAADAMPYGASKAALVNVTKSIARSFGSDNVVAMAVAPGWVNTDMAAEFVERHGLDAALGDIPIRAMAEPSEVGDLVAFLMRDDQRSLNGATIDVNGGSYIR